MPTTRETITAPNAPEAVGPYTHAVRTGDLLFCSGQIALDGRGDLVGDTAGEQVEQCLRNLQAVCDAAGTSLDRAVRCTVYLTDMAAFTEVNEVYARFFQRDPPARVGIGVASLPKGAQVEVEAVIAL